MFTDAFGDHLDPTERELFEREMSGVQPIKKQQRSLTPAQSSSPTEAQLKRREHAAREGEEDNFLSDEFVELIAHDHPLEFRRDGIQTGLMHKLSQGRYAIESQLNLLRRPLSECRQAVFTFIRDAEHHQLRSLLIVHGRSKRDEGGPNVLRSYLAKWLVQFEQVQAFCSAHPRHGSLGATYVVLRKSARARRENRERHLGRRGG